MESKEGDYFTIPLKNGSVGVGYLIARATPCFFMGALGQQFESESTFDPALLFEVSNFKFFGNFFNSKLKNGDWKKLGNARPDQSRFPFPNTKIKNGADYVIETWNRSILRKATVDDILYYDNPTNRAPKILENALNAFFGLHEWNPEYRKITAEYVFEQSKLI
jgi:hypothetical protein